MSGRALSQFKLLVARMRAKVAELSHGGAMAPGALTAEDDKYRQDQFTLVQRRAKYGDVFKIWWNGKITTCLVGHTAGKKFLTDNRQNLRVATINMSALFPHGFIRAMEGETHAKYRKLLVAAFKAVSLEDREHRLREIIAPYVHAIAEGDGRPSSARIAQISKQATTAIMLELVLGVRQGSDTARAITDALNEYAPNGMQTVVREREERGYLKLKTLVTEHIAQGFGEDREPESLLEFVVRSEALDDTVLGNLIHMTEFGRFDVHGLWRWILLEVAAHPDYMQRISDEADLQQRRAMCESVAYEMLRMQQSEYVYRSATKTFSYKGLLIPRRSRVRICVWEGHRDPAKFPEPNSFVPDRFLPNAYPSDVYAPFGLDHHRCLGSNWTITLSGLLVDTIAKEYRLELQDYGRPVPGHFHFEPGPDAKVVWTARAA